MSNNQIRKKKGLGRGLAALIGESAETAEKNSPTIAAEKYIPIEMIKIGNFNPRREFRNEELENLSHSIKQHGIIQPILVRPIVNSAGGQQKEYELIAGERRWRAAQMAALHKVPVIIRQADDKEVLELALIENIQRTDLNPIEESMGYQKLMQEHNYRQEDLAQILGKSRSHIANILRLLNLPQNVLSLVESGELSASHARALVALDNPISLAQKIMREGLSVRATEKYAAEISEGKNRKTKKAIEKTADEKAIEKKLYEAIGLKVSLVHKNSGKGKLIIHYDDVSQLNNFIDKLV